LSADLHRRRILVTGGSMGLGLAVCQVLAAQGARVVAASRGRTDLEAAVSELEGSGHEALVLDVSDAAAWPQAMATIDRGGALDGLVTAAGILGPIGALETAEMEQFAATIAINLVGTALALHHALPRLRLCGGRAVTFSGGGGTGPLPRFDAYAASKAAVVRLTENVATETGVPVNCVAPGFVATRIHDDTLAAGPEAAGAAYYERTRAQLQEGGFPASEAAELVAYLLSDGAGQISGRLISAQWDPWRDEAFRDRLRGDPDLGRLRRIDDQFYVRAT
jgi:NAD(P)-dependent dehydrogenase (short-subunit alcohol dehydrogenase family)